MASFQTPAPMAAMQTALGQLSKTHHNIVRQLREDRAAKAKKELADVVNSETAKLQAATARASAKAKEAIAAARDEVTERYDDLCAALKVAAGAAPGGDLDAALAQLLASSEAAVEGKTAAVEAVAGTAAERVRKVLEEDAGKVEAQFAALAEAERAKAERELARQIVQLEEMYVVMEKTMQAVRLMAMRDGAGGGASMDVDGEEDKEAEDGGY